MSWNRAQIREQARIHAKDVMGAVDDLMVNALFSEVYLRYDKAVMRERAKNIGHPFVTFAVDDYVATSTVDALDVQSLELDYGDLNANMQSDGPLGALERDDFYAVVSDAVNGHFAVGQVPQRFGVMKIQNSLRWRVAVCPKAADTVNYTAIGHAEATAITDDTTTLDAMDTDCYDIARFLAAEIMRINGDDPADIDAVLEPVNANVNQKMSVLAARNSKPQADAEPV